jgi:hypothetical protein
MFTLIVQAAFVSENTGGISNFAISNATQGDFWDSGLLKQEGRWKFSIFPRGELAAG